MLTGIMIGLCSVLEAQNYCLEYRGWIVTPKDKKKKEI